MEDILDNNRVVDNYNKFRKRAILTWLSIGFVRIILKFSKGFPSRPEEVLEELIGSLIIFRDSPIFRDQIFRDSPAIKTQVNYM